MNLCKVKNHSPELLKFNYNNKKGTFESVFLNNWGESVLLVRVKRVFGFCFRKLRLLQTKDLRTLLTREILAYGSHPPSKRILKEPSFESSFNILGRKDSNL